MTAAEDAKQFAALKEKLIHDIRVMVRRYVMAPGGHIRLRHPSELHRTQVYLVTPSVTPSGSSTHSL